MNFDIFPVIIVVVFVIFLPNVVNGQNTEGESKTILSSTDCVISNWTIVCNEDRTVCYDAKMQPKEGPASKPTKRFLMSKKAKLGKECELDKDLAKDFFAQIGNGTFLEDYIGKWTKEKGCSQKNEGKVASRIASHFSLKQNKQKQNETNNSTQQTSATLASGMTKSGEQTATPPYGTLASMKCDFSDWENAAFVDVCDNNIYCHGRIIQAMNYHLFRNLFKNDSKHFVDSPLAKDMDADKVMAEFDKQFPNTTKIKDMNAAELEKFYHTYFLHPNDTSVALKICDDFKKEPEKLNEIKDETMRKWAVELHKRWGELCRQIPLGAKDSTNHHSLIYVQNRFIVPGGRFREYYYWDSLWTIKGLLASGYNDLAKEMIWNFFDLVKKMKFVPNGGRIYYKMRSQPPLLIRMVWEYVKQTEDIGMLRDDRDGNDIKNIEVLEEELKFWEQNRNVTFMKDGKKYKMYQYRTDSQVPRPESFCVDVLTAMELKKAKGGNLSDEEAGKLFQNLASAAESGWDFSSRWMANPDEPKLSEIITTQIVPVDLNAYICGNYRLLAELYAKIRNEAKVNEYVKKYKDFRVAFKKVFLVVQNDGESKTGWYDYNLATNQNNVRFYGSMAVPLYMKCYHKNDEKLFESLYNTFATYGAFDKGNGNGMPTSMKDSGQQWDLPNIWPPLVHMMIEGFRGTNYKKMVDKAAEMAKEWIFANYKVYNKHCNHPNMWEKLTTDGEPGGGGEYEVQPGFGWTNGAILDLLVTYNNGEIEWGNRTLPPCLPANQSVSSRKSWSFHKHFKTLG